MARGPRTLRGDSVRADLRLLSFGLLLLPPRPAARARAGIGSSPPRRIHGSKGGAPASVVGLVKYLNENARLVKAVRIDDVSIDATMGNQPFGLRGTLFVEKPRNFRMKVTAFGKDEVDIGSNSNEFWFWAAQES